MADTTTKKENEMIKTIENAGNYRRAEVLKHPVKTTALLYLKEALLSEAYERCPEIITFAREFGAAPFEITDLLEDPRRTPG
jgi:hypothetical protein